MFNKVHMEMDVTLKVKSALYRTKEHTKIKINMTLTKYYIKNKRILYSEVIKLSRKCE